MVRLPFFLIAFAIKMIHGISKYRYEVRLLITRSYLNHKPRKLTWEVSAVVAEAVFSRTHRRRVKPPAPQKCVVTPACTYETPSLELLVANRLSRRILFFSRVARMIAEYEQKPNVRSTVYM